mgnify:CR=1 FL=1
MKHSTMTGQLYLNGQLVGDVADHVPPRALVPLYALALFVSALLAFWIQPLFAKIILPRYGGSPAVWRNLRQPLPSAVACPCPPRRTTTATACATTA